MSPYLLQLNHLDYAGETTIADAAVLLCISQETNPKLLFTRRSPHLRTHAGEISFPGGKREANDKYNFATAFREAQEEVAILPHHLKLKGYLPPEKSKSQLIVQPVVATLEAQCIANLKPDRQEVDSLFWISIAKLIHTKTTLYTFRRKNIDYAFPAFRQENDIIWGLTWRILMNLLKDIVV